jgi:hypothetical protein
MVHGNESSQLDELKRSAEYVFLQAFENQEKAKLLRRYSIYSEILEQLWQLHRHELQHAVNNLELTKAYAAIHTAGTDSLNDTVLKQLLNLISDVSKAIAHT